MGKSKLTDRVHDMKHPCPFCEKAPKNFAHHIFTKKHSQEDAIKKFKIVSDKKERENMIAKLRLKAAHEHNMRVMEEKKGDLSHA